MNRLVFYFSIFSLGIHQSMSLQKRIVGGQEIDITKVPYTLSLRLDDDHICGASIISEDWGLTAAHCFETSGETSKYSVRSGSSFADKGGEIHNIKNIIPNEGYDDSTTDYDIAVFQVEPSFSFDDTTKAINLPGSDLVNDTFGVIAGWGYYKKPKGDNNTISENLRYTIVPKVERAICSQDYEGLYDLTPRQVCYGYKKGGKDACEGDSGGPLVAGDNIQIGITSWGEECARPKSPGVYTSMFLMVDWIYNKTGIQAQT